MYTSLNGVHANRIVSRWKRSLEMVRRNNGSSYDLGWTLWLHPLQTFRQSPLYLKSRISTTELSERHCVCHTSIGIDLAAFGEFIKARTHVWVEEKSCLEQTLLRKVHVFIYATNVLFQVLADCRELRSVDTHHTELVNLRANSIKRWHSPSRKLRVLCPIFEDQRA